jgi:putative phosphoribosyl transferase
LAFMHSPLTTTPMFKDRKDAALHLAKALEKYKGLGVIVLGIPRGGAETGFYVAKHLGADFSLLVSRKLGHPNNPEYAIGAIAEDGSFYLNEKAQAGLSPDVLEHTIAQQKKEIARRIDVLRNGEPLPKIRNKTVILVDDGIATGSTLFASIKMCRNQGVGKLVVAAPVAGPEMKSRLLREVEDVVILETPDYFQAVSQAYKTFYNLTDEETIEFFNRWKENR